MRDVVISHKTAAKNCNWGLPTGATTRKKKKTNLIDTHLVPLIICRTPVHPV